MNRRDRPSQPASAAPPPAPHGLVTVADRLFAEGFQFDFFQAVCLLQALHPDRARVGHGGPPAQEAVRFRAHVSLSFPPSSIADLRQPPTLDQPVELVQPFLGLFGPSGVLPRHYTELLLRLGQDRQLDERHALRDWLDLFNHRLVALFYRSWEKYRPLLRGMTSPAASPPGPSASGLVGAEVALEDRVPLFTQALLSFVGVGTQGLRHRLGVAGTPTQRPRQVDDLALLRYAGLLAHRPRSAEGLRVLLKDHFGLEVAIAQFRGRWLALESASQSRLATGPLPANNRLGLDVVVGEHVWDVQGAFRVCLGPLTYGQFRRFLPEPTRSSAGFFLAQLVRLYVGPALDFDLQLVLKRGEIPRCRLPVGPNEGPVLGWDCWLIDQAPALDSDDVIFTDADLEAQPSAGQALTAR